MVVMVVVAMISGKDARVDEGGRSDQKENGLEEEERRMRYFCNFLVPPWEMRASRYRQEIEKGNIDAGLIPIT